MKIKYLLNESDVIIAIQYKEANKNSTTHYNLVAENVELPSNPTYSEMEIDNVDRVHLGYSQVINGVFYENFANYNDHLQAVRKAKEEESRINTIKQEMAGIKAWLNANDYIINKHTLGEYSDTDPRWTNYLAERKVKLARYNELELEV